MHAEGAILLDVFLHDFEFDGLQTTVIGLVVERLGRCEVASALIDVKTKQSAEVVAEVVVIRQVIVMSFPSCGDFAIGANGQKEVETVPGLMPIARIHVLFGRKTRNVQKMNLAFGTIFVDGDMRCCLQRSRIQEHAIDCRCREQRQRNATMLRGELDNVRMYICVVQRIG